MLNCCNQAITLIMQPYLGRMTGNSGVVPDLSGNGESKTKKNLADLRTRLAMAFLSLLTIPFACDSGDSQGELHAHPAGQTYLTHALLEKSK